MPSSKIIEHLRHRFSDAPSVVVVGIYCNYNKSAAGTQNLKILLGSLCAQLSSSKTELPKGILGVYSGTPKSRSPEIEDLRRLLKSEISTFMKAFIIVDGLDEYPESNQSE